VVLEGEMAKRKAEPKPLERFDYGLVAPKIAGLRFNLDRDIERRTQEAIRRADADSDRCLSLLNIMLRFAWNSYESVLYLAGDVPDDPRRKPNYVLVVPNINRQLLDMLFTLAYMLDDFRPRSMAYQRSGFRELHEEIQTFRNTFGSDPGWKEYFKNTKSALSAMADRFNMTPEERKRPKLIPFWKTPYQLLEEKSACRDFLKYLEKWLYKDTSAQAHMSFGGMFKISLFLIADLVGEDAKKQVNDRPMKVYHFTQISRTAISFLAIATEIDTFCRFGNREQINYIWTVFSGYAAEAKEMWDLRYRDRP
jgi:hypothetical protein